MNALVVTIDGWHAGFAGPWGNTWLPTPGMNRLAAESLVFDQAYLDDARPGASLGSWWTGRSTTGYLTQAAARGVNTLLVTDDAEAARRREGEGFSVRRWMASAAPSEPCDSEDETELMRFFTAALAETAELAPPFLAWLHTLSLTRAWDAPVAIRNSFVDDEEPLPPQGVEVPARRLVERDPDELLGYRRAYAGQIVVLDECLAALHEALRSTAQGPTLLIVGGTRGFPLGEHAEVGFPPGGGELHEELVHFPLLVRMPGDPRYAGRSQALVEPADVAATLRDWFAAPPDAESPGRSLLPLVRGEPVEWREELRMVSGEASALRTSRWLLSKAGGSAPAKLFAKPDDRWERNDVADRCAGVVEELEGGGG